MKPTEKSKEIDNFLTEMNGISRQEARDKQICTNCKQEVKGFKDKLSKNEYQINGLCQKCQDEVFY